MDICYGGDSSNCSTASSAALEEDPPQESFTCRWNSCECTFSSLAMLGAHVTENHAQGRRETGLFYCCWQGCRRSNKAFNARYKMLIHVRTHTLEKPYICTECSKPFSRPENLKIHYRTHTGERPYTCPIDGCSKAYSNSSDRFKHVRTHIMEKPYFCKIPGCGKRYTDPSSLRKHVKTAAHFDAWDGLYIQESPLDLTLK